MQEADGFSDFYEVNFHRVLNACYVWCGDTDLAHDATQEAFGRAFARWGRLRNEPWRDGWVLVTATNWLKRYRFRLRRERVGSESASIKDVPSRWDIDLVHSIRDLPTRQRQAILLHYFADYSIAVVADLMDISTGAVKSHLSRARTTLRDTYDEDRAGTKLEIQEARR